MSALPEFYTVVNTLIAEIAKERGVGTKDFKEALLAKIKEGEDADTSTPNAAKTNTEHRR